MTTKCRRLLELMIISFCFLGVFLLLCFSVQAESENLIHDETVLAFHEWDDGLSDWQNGRSDFYTLRTEAEKSGMISDGRVSIVYDTIYLDEEGISAGQMIRLSGEFAYFPNDGKNWAYMGLNFCTDNHEDLEDYTSEMITSTKETGSEFREIVERIPINTGYIRIYFVINKAGESEHFYFRNIKLESVEGMQTEPSENINDPAESSFDSFEDPEKDQREMYSDDDESKDADPDGEPLGRDEIDVSGYAFLNTQGYYVLTMEDYWQNGTLWIRNPQKKNNFTIDFDFYTGSGEIDGADGICLLFYVDRDTVSGEGGGADLFPASSGYGVEIDTHCNLELGDTNINHFAILKDNPSNHLSTADASVFTEDGHFHHMRVEVEDGICFVYVDGSRMMGIGGITPTGNYDIGIHAVTGDSYNLHVVKNIVVNWSGKAQEEMQEEMNVPETADTPTPVPTITSAPIQTPVPTITSIPVSEQIPPSNREGMYVFKDRNGKEYTVPESSFASYVVDFVPGDPWTNDEICKDPNQALGLPDFVSDSSDARTNVTIGYDGVIILGFDVGICDGPGPDVYVFEVGGGVEATQVELSNDLVTWYDVGKTEGSTDSLDIEGKVPEGQSFQYVRLRDVGHQISEWPGADIDAVCGLNTREIQPSPDPLPADTSAPAEISEPAWSGTPRMREDSTADFGGNTYAFYEDEKYMSWSDAKAFCEQKGGHLATINSPEEQAFLKNTYPGTAGWIGGYRDGETWMWVTGESFEFTSWKVDEPNNSGGNERCLHLYTEMNWNDLPNEDKVYHSGFYCEWENSGNGRTTDSMMDKTDEQERSAENPETKDEEAAFSDDSVQRNSLYRDPAKYTTSETAALSDTQWITYDILHGTPPSGVERLDEFEEVTGGWKAYIISDPENQFDAAMEMFLNVQIDGTADNAVLDFDWDYNYIWSLGEGAEDNNPDSVFSGSFEGGEISALGEGSVQMSCFYYANGHEYGIGTIMWPDGITGEVMLMRP